MKIIAIDAGTTNMKSQVFDESGPISEISSVPVSNAFDIEKGIVFADKYFKALIKCVEKTLSDLKDHNIHAIGLTTIGPSLVLCEEDSCSRIARSYNYPSAPEGVKKILKMNLYHERGVSVGSQYTPEQIVQMRFDKILPRNSHFTTIASYLCHLLGGDLSKWTYPEASYNGLLNIQTGNYSRRIFRDLKLSYSWFPQLTSGQVGYLSKSFINKFKLNKNRKIFIFNFGTDGPAVQAYFGDKYTTFKIESTGAVRVKGENPIFDSNPIIKGFPGVWNLLFKEPDGEKYFISGATMNSGVNTLKHYFPKATNTDFKKLDNKLVKFINKGIPDTHECGVELPFEFGERDGIERKSGIQGKKPKSKIALYYTLKEAVMFNMMQRVELVRNAQIDSDNSLNNKFLITGPITISKPWQDLALIMLNKIIGINNPELIKSKFKEIGLATVAKGIFRKLGLKDKISTEGKSFKLDRKTFSNKNASTLMNRWKKYLYYYNTRP